MVTTDTFVNDLRKMLGKPRFLELMLLSPPMRKMEKRPTTVIVYYLLCFFCYGTEVFFVFPYLSLWAVYVNLAFVGLTHVFFFTTACSSPGYLTNKNVDF